jgi:hypothetical protein
MLDHLSVDELEREIKYLKNLIAEREAKIAVTKYVDLKMFWTELRDISIDNLSNREMALSKRKR